MQNLRDAIDNMNAQPDISAGDSERLRGFCRMTAVEIKAVGGVSAATSLEMIGYIRELERRTTSPTTDTVLVSRAMVALKVHEYLTRAGHTKLANDLAAALRRLPPYTKEQHDGWN